MSSNEFKNLLHQDTQRYITDLAKETGSVQTALDELVRLHRLVARMDQTKDLTEGEE